MIVTAEGMSIRFNGSEVARWAGRQKEEAIQLKGDDRVVFGSQIEDDGHLVVVTDRGIETYFISDYQIQGRSIGFRTITFTRIGLTAGIFGAFYAKHL